MNIQKVRREQEKIRKTGEAVELRQVAFACFLSLLAIDVIKLRMDSAAKHQLQVRDSLRATQTFCSGSTRGTSGADINFVLSHTHIFQVYTS